MDKISSGMLPREKIMRFGVEKLEVWELFAVVLGVGYPGKGILELSKDIIEGISANSSYPNLEELVQIKGIGEAKACKILAVLELSKRFIPFAERASLNCPEDFIPLLAPLKFANQEEFWVFTLDSTNKLIQSHAVTKGLVNQSPIHPREVFAPAIVDRAVNLVLCHNHPSGSLKPSRADLDVTRELVSLGSQLKIPILDHIIVSSKGICSLSREMPDLFLYGP